MNLILHGIGSEKAVPVIVGDALAADPGKRFDVVLANPPFGKKSSTMIASSPRSRRAGDGMRYGDYVEQLT